MFWACTFAANIHNKWNYNVAQMSVFNVHSQFKSFILLDYEKLLWEVEFLPLV